MLQLSTHEVVEVCGKILYQVELARNTLDIMWGFSVEAELVENSEKQVINKRGEKEEKTQLLIFVFWSGRAVLLCVSC